MRSIYPFQQICRFLAPSASISEQPHTNKAQQIRTVLFATLILGFLAHGYAFLNASYTHDSLNAIYADGAENAWKITLGRIFKPIYQTLFCGGFAVPWLIGVLSLLWTGLSIFLLVRMFSISAPICILLFSGICITNLTFILTTATYIHDLDSNMFALLLSTLAAFMWKQKKGISLTALLCIALSLGIYQSFIYVCIVLMILSSLMDLLHGKRFLPVFKKGITGCITLLLGAIAYAICLVVVRRFTGYSLSSNSGNSLSLLSSLNLKGLLSAIKNTYVIMYAQLIRDWMVIFPLWFIKVTHVLLAISTLVPFLMQLKHVIGVKEALLFLLLLLVIPPAVYLSMLLSGGESLHHLMLYALWLLYLFPVLIVYQFPCSAKNRVIQGSRILTALILSILIWGNIRTSNTLYLLKDMQYEGAKSLMTRVLYRIEDSEEYVTGETPVALIGTSRLLSQIPNTEQYSRFVGIPITFVERSPNAAYDPQYKLMTYVLGSAMRLCDDDTYSSLRKNSDVNQMPLYPAEGCMKMIDGTFVVKLGN